MNRNRSASSLLQEFPPLPEGRRCAAAGSPKNQSHRMNSGVPKTETSLLIIPLMMLHIIPCRQKQGLAGETSHDNYTRSLQLV